MRKNNLYLANQNFVSNFCLLSVTVIEWEPW